MRFIDEARIEVTSGRGGDGCLSFRREAHVPRGGPDGGDGGRGGDVVLVATDRRNTLLELRGHSIWRADDGEPGRGKRWTGQCAKHVEIEVPVGTRVFDDDTDTLLGDLVEDGARLVVARGGAGGLGNWHFKSSTNRTPQRTTPGGDGEDRAVRLELMLMADVGLLGFPNAGKSTFLSRVSAARPKVADYPFTTLVPSLGVVRLEEDATLVVADIPGLIPGAAEGAGLGLQFLRHLGRTRVVLHLISASELDEAAAELSVRARYRALRAELEAYDEALAAQPEIVVLTKADAVDDARLAALRAELGEELGAAPWVVSAVRGDGLRPVLHAALHIARGEPA
jgi:GTPase